MPTRRLSWKFLANVARAQQRRHYASSKPTLKRGLALVLGVANERSIAWACVKSFLQKNYDCIITYHVPPRMNTSNSNSNESHEEDDTVEIMHREKYQSKIEKLAGPYLPQQPQLHHDDDDDDDDDDTNPPRIIACLPCCVETDLPKLCRVDLPNAIRHYYGAKKGSKGGIDHDRTIDAVVHSVAYASEMDRPLLQVSSAAYLQAQHISAYSLIELVRECLQNERLSQPTASITTLSYLGATRTVPNYGIMSPAKAALESIVRTLAYEVGQYHHQNGGGGGSIGRTVLGGESRYTNLRVNAVSAGPLKTTSARGITNFSYMSQHVNDHAPLRRNVTVDEVAETITWLSTSGTGITGQTIYVDAGYSTMVPIGTP